jgi:hypothetical protein
MSVDDRPIAPAEAAIYGLAAGLTATLLISAVSRIPRLRKYAGRSSWADRSMSAGDQEWEAELETTAPMSPATALVQASGPGPEGPAGLFAAKVASGLFGRDLATRTQPWGRAVHFAYGSLWGVVYGILQTRRTRRPMLSGVAHGLFVWAFGPALLVPAMKLMPTPNHTPRAQRAFVAAAHALYGVTVATMFSRLSRRGSSHEQPSLHLRDRH